MLSSSSSSPDLLCWTSSWSDWNCWIFNPTTHWGSSGTLLRTINQQSGLGCLLHCSLRNLFYIVVIPLMVQISQNVTVSPFFSRKTQITPSWTWRYFSLTDTTGNECCRVTLNCRLLPSAHPLFSRTFAFNFNNTKTYLDLGWCSVLNDESLWLCFHVWTSLVETLLRLLTQLHMCCDPFLRLSSLCFCKRGVYFFLYKI